MGMMTPGKNNNPDYDIDTPDFRRFLLGFTGP